MKEECGSQRVPRKSFCREGIRPAIRRNVRELNLPAWPKKAVILAKRSTLSGTMRNRKTPGAERSKSA
jgi:hypothetical protein